MFIFANFFSALAGLLDIAINIYMFIMIAHVILSWIRFDPNHQLVQFIYRVTEPVLMQVRRYIPPFGGLDFSPLVVIIVLQFARSFLVKTLYDMANAL